MIFPKYNTVIINDTKNGYILYDMIYDKAVMLKNCVILYKDNNTYILDRTGNNIYSNNENIKIINIFSEVNLMFVVNNKKLEVRDLKGNTLSIYNNFNIENPYGTSSLFMNVLKVTYDNNVYKISYYDSSEGENGKDYSLKYNKDTNQFYDLNSLLR